MSDEIFNGRFIASFLPNVPVKFGEDMDILNFDDIMLF